MYLYLRRINFCIKVNAEKREATSVQDTLTYLKYRKNGMIDKLQSCLKFHTRFFSRMNTLNTMIYKEYYNEVT